MKSWQNGAHVGCMSDAADELLAHLSASGRRARAWRRGRPLFLQVGERMEIRVEGVVRAGALAVLLLAAGPAWTEDVEAIAGILRDRQVAWNERDAAAWVEHVTADSGFVSILGMRFADRAANEARHAALFATIFRESSLTVEILDVRFADRDSAIVEARLRITGYERLPPGIRETAPGILEARLVARTI